MFEILLVEDDDAVRNGVGRVLSEAGTLHLVEACPTATDALRVIDTDATIDLALVDIGLPDGSGTAVIQRLRDTRPDAVALAFTIFADDVTIFSALKAGARGYLLKDTSPDELVASVHQALTGGAPLTPAVARRVVDSFVPIRNDETNLTPREREILELMCHGISYREAADQLGIGAATVQTHVKSIYRKLGVSSKAEATKVAIQRGLFVP